MKLWTMSALLLGCLAVGGCNGSEDKDLYTAPKPLDKMSNEEWCAFYGRYITNPAITPQAKETDLQRMRQRGCPMPG